MFLRTCIFSIYLASCILSLSAKSNDSPYLLDLDQSFMEFIESISFKNKSSEERWQLIDRIVAYSLVIDRCNEVYPLYTPLKKSQFIIKEVIQSSLESSGLKDYDLSLRKNSIDTEVGRAIYKISQPYLKSVCQNVSILHEDVIEESITDEENNIDEEQDVGFEG